MTVIDTAPLPSITATDGPDEPALPGASGVYDPDVDSDGLTVDTDLGPVDLVAIERARAGRPVDLTAAEVAYLLAHLPGTYAAARPVAVALGVCTDTVLRRSRRTPTGRKVA